MNFDLFGFFNVPKQNKVYLGKKREEASAQKMDRLKKFPSACTFLWLSLSPLAPSNEFEDRGQLPTACGLNSACQVISSHLQSLHIDGILAGQGFSSGGCGGILQ